jgi:hypothetical protein
MVTLAPLVEIVEGVLVVMAVVTCSRYPLDSPAGSILTLTSYHPLCTLGIVKVMEVAVVEVGVTTLTKLVFLCVKTTTGVPRLKLLPVSVTLPEEMELTDIEVNLGDREESMYENWHWPPQVLSTISLLVRTTG